MLSLMCFVLLFLVFDNFNIMSLPSLDFSFLVDYIYMHSCFGFLDFDLIQFINVFLSAKLPLHKNIFLSLCGFLNPLIPPPCPIFGSFSTTWYISEFVHRHNEKNVCIIYNAVFVYLYLGLYGFWPEIKFYYYIIIIIIVIEYFF